MRAASSLLFLLGCNEVYGLDRTRPIDAAFFDAPADAPYACPPLGNPPLFSRVFEQIVTQPCTSYTVSLTGRALARCPIGGIARIAEGPIGEMLRPAPGFDEPNTNYDLPRIGPSGSVAVARTGAGQFHLFTRDDVRWQRRQPITLPGFTILTVSAPTRSGRVFAVVAGSVRELADDGNGSFAEVRAHTFAALGVGNLTEQLHVTADGLRLLTRTSTSNGSELVYTDRADENAPFGAVVPLPEISFVPEGFMTEDCARLYFSGLGNIFAAVAR